MLGFAVFLAVFGQTDSGSAQTVKFQRFLMQQAALTEETEIHPVNLLSGPELEFVFVARGQAVIYGQSANGFVPLQAIPLPLPPDDGQHLYYGFARVESTEYHSLVILSPGSVSYYPRENTLLATIPRVLFPSRLVTQPSPGPLHRHFDLALDLDGDGYDEILLPADNGFSISRRVQDGSYAPLKLPRDSFKEENSFTFSRDTPESQTGPAYFMTSLTQRRGTNDLLFFDADGDGKLDLIYSSTSVGPGSRQVERYDVYIQGENLTFSDNPSQSFAVPYDSQADATFRDINKDGRLDAILVRSNMDIVNPRTVVKFYIGQKDGYQVFTRETDRFVTRDPVGLVQLNDFNNDGITDFAMTFFSYQFGSMEDIVDLAFANKIQFRLQFFLGRGAQGFPRQPDTEHQVTLNTKLENFRGNPPVTIVKDMNGDGMMDLVVRNSPTDIQIFLSRGNYELSPNPAATFKIPEDATLSFADVNANGLTDIIVSDSTSKHFSVIVPIR